MSKYNIDVSFMNNNEYLLLNDLGKYIFIDNQNINHVCETIDEAELFVKSIQSCRIFQGYMKAVVRIGGVTCQQYIPMTDSFEYMKVPFMKYDSFVEYFKGELIEYSGIIKK